VLYEVRWVDAAEEMEVAAGAAGETAMAVDDDDAAEEEEMDVGEVAVVEENEMDVDAGVPSTALAASRVREWLSALVRRPEGVEPHDVAREQLRDVSLADRGLLRRLHACVDAARAAEPSEPCAFAVRCEDGVLVRTTLPALSRPPAASAVGTSAEARAPANASRRDAVVVQGAVGCDFVREIDAYRKTNVPRGRRTLWIYNDNEQASRATVVVA
jgi:hypothetical protein